MGRVVSLILLCVVAFAVVDARAEPPRGKNTQENIDKCDREQAACKSSCDRTIIDIDDNVDRCKKGCDTDRGLCLQYLVGGPTAGNRSDGTTTRSPGGTSTPHSSKVCCKWPSGRTRWIEYARCKRYGHSPTEPRKCTAPRKSP